MPFVYAIDPADPAGTGLVKNGAPQLRNLKAGLVERVNSFFDDIDANPWTVKDGATLGNVNVKKLTPVTDLTYPLGDVTHRFTTLYAQTAILSNGLTVSAGTSALQAVTATTLAVTTTSVLEGAVMLGVGANGGSLTWDASYTYFKANAGRLVALGDVASTALIVAPTLTQAAGTGLAAQLLVKVNQSGTAGYEALELAITETTVGSGARNAMRVLVGGTETLLLSTDGLLSLTRVSAGTVLSTMSADGVVDFARNKITTGDMATMQLSGKNDASAATVYGYLVARAMAVTAGAESADLVFAIRKAAAFVEVLKLDGSTVAGDIRMLVYDVTAGGLVHVSRGAADSGGTGVRALCIPN